MNSPSISISWKRVIEIVLLNVTMEFFNNSNINLWELRQILCKKIGPPAFWAVVGRFERFFSIRKTYFLQVKRLILVGTLEQCAFLSPQRDP